MKLSETDKKIARLIIRAQDCSDAGKRISSGNREAEYLAYNGKSEQIILALKSIFGAKRTIFSAYSTKEPDQNGYPSILTYFEFNVDGEEYQISFHTPYREALQSGLTRFVGKGKETKWNGVYGGSRNARDKLFELIKEK